jgi:hypothetical protein
MECGGLAAAFEDENPSPSRAICATPTASFLFLCFRPVANFCTSDQFRHLHNPLKINRDRQSPASFPHRFRSTSQPAFGVLLRFSTSVRFPVQPSTLLTQKSQFVAPLFSWPYKFLFPQLLSFDKYLRCPPGVGSPSAFLATNWDSSIMHSLTPFAATHPKLVAASPFPATHPKKQGGGHDYR